MSIRNRSFDRGWHNYMEAKEAEEEYELYLEEQESIRLSENGKLCNTCNKWYIHKDVEGCPDCLHLAQIEAEAAAFRAEHLQQGEPDNQSTENQLNQEGPEHTEPLDQSNQTNDYPATWNTLEEWGQPTAY